MAAHERGAGEGVFDGLNLVSQDERADATFIIIEHIDVVAFRLDIIDILKFYSEIQRSCVVVEIDDIRVVSHHQIPGRCFLGVVVSIRIYYAFRNSKNSLRVDNSEAEVSDDKRKSQCYECDEDTLSNDYCVCIFVYIHDPQ